jgi:hypothetical protein
MSEREIVVDWDRFRIYVKGWSFEHGNWPMVSPGHQRDCLSLLREVEELEKDRDRLREGIRELGKAWACSNPEGPSTREEMTANECAADLWALLEIPQEEKEDGPR